MNNHEYNINKQKKYKITNPPSDCVSFQIIYNYNSTDILSRFYLNSTFDEFNSDANLLSFIN